MVCEPPRQRQLLVSRRGTFFEDPFFKDGWDDYSHAVRRIVDRFNHGWVSPSERWRDSQYHSMYRTLRTARLNYSTHSARFKEEGHVYKLVMDVRDFVGGDITVRTAGGTVSVRGKLEVRFEEEGKNGRGKNDDDDRSTLSGRSTTAKTLHRRFTLPADADCDKVESSLSKDAVLTVTIPRRTDVHYIPVTLESDTNKENESSVDSRNSWKNGSTDTARQPGVKRPSDSPHGASRKKSQDETFTRRNLDKNTEEKENEIRNFRRRSRDVEAEGKRRRKEEESRDESSERRSRRRDSKYEDVREISIPIRFSKSDSPEKIFRPSSIHEDKKENETVLSENEFSSHNVESNLRSNNNHHSQDNSDAVSINSGASEENKLSYDLIKVRGSSYWDEAPPPSSQVSCTSKSSPSELCTSLGQDLPLVKSLDTEEVQLKSGSAWKAQQLNKLNSVIKNGSSLSEGVSSPISKSLADLKKEQNVEINLLDDEPINDKLDRKTSLSTEQTVRKMENHSKDNQPPVIKSDQILKTNMTKSLVDKSDTNYLYNLPNFIDNNQSTNVGIDKKYDCYDEVLPSKNNTSIQGKSIDDAYVPNIKINLNDSLVPEKVPDKLLVDKTEDIKLRDITTPVQHSLQSKHSLQMPKTSLHGRSASPVSPGGRDVPVEKRQSLMEEDMFKDCWSDFSNTLQDVLTRLQELSSELGVSKIIAATPSEEASQTPLFPKLETKTMEDSDLPFSKKNEPGTSEGGKILPSEKPLSPAYNQLHAFSREYLKTNNVGGIEGREGGAKEETWPAHTLPGTCHDPLGVCNHAIDKVLSDVSQANIRRHLPDDVSCRDTSYIEEKSFNFGPYKRPLSLHLQNVASPTCDSSSGENRRSSLLVNETPIAESLLPGLRKNSPVEALQERFHQWRKDEANRRFGYIEEQRRAAPVGGQKEVDGRPLSTLSPSKEQLSSVPGQRSVRQDAKNNLLPSDINLACSDDEVSDSTDVRSIPGGKPKTEDKTLPILNDLNVRYRKEAKGTSFEFNHTIPPNIDASPESNVTDESESGSVTAEEGVVEGRFTFPVQGLTSNVEVLESNAQVSLNDSILKNGVNDVANIDDVFGFSAKKGHPEILSDDVMGCERPLTASSRVPLRGAKEVPLRSNRFQKHREPLILQEGRGDAKSEREADVAMGGSFSRGRKSKDPLDETPKLIKSPSPSHSASNRSLKQIIIEEKPIPPYVRQRSEATKRYSGFAHVNSDNVRRMRDVWGSRQDTKPPASPSLVQKVPPDSPTRTTFSRRTSDVLRSNEVTEPRQNLVSSPSERSRSSPLRKSSPSPIRSPASASLSRTRFTYPEVATSTKTNGSIAAESKQNQRPSYSSPVRHGSHDRVGSPTMSSLCSSRRCSHGTKESSPRLSPSEKTINGEFGKRSTESPSRASKGASERNTTGTSSEPLPGATRAHQKIFKRLRNANLQPDSEAICFKEEEDRYKMVLDVEEFVPGEIEVLQDDRVLTVKGRVETKEGGGRMIIKTFNRTFSIPKNSKEEDIDSALSQDGILIIFVPKKRERIIKIELVD